MWTPSPAAHSLAGTKAATPLANTGAGNCSGPGTHPPLTSLPGPETVLVCICTHSLTHSLGPSLPLSLWRLLHVALGAFAEAQGGEERDPEDL